MTPQAWDDTKTLAWSVLPVCSLTFYIEWVVSLLTPPDAITTITVVLAALSALLAALGIMIAIFAIWGYSNIKDHVAQKAEQIATQVAERVASEKAGSVAARVAESIANQNAGESGDYGKAAGDDSGKQTTV